MTPHAPLRPAGRRVAALGLLSGLLLAACGGGGGGGPGAPGGTPAMPPTSLSYSAPDVVYRTDAAIVPNVATVGGGTPEAFSVVPALPGGLALDGSTGDITGTPLAPSPAASYTITASNADGDVSADVTIEVQWAEWKSLAPKAGLTTADFRHFLRRTHWAARDAELASIQGGSLSAFIDQMLAWPAVGTQQFEVDARAQLLDVNDPPGQEGLFPSATDLVRWHISLMMNDPNPFREVMALFWHDHFATSSDVLDGGRLYFMENHINLWRSSLAVGQLRDLLEAMARDWAMLWWLDGRISTASAPNENFGREFLELFCLGADNGYTQADIVELSKVFTGYQDVVLDPTTGLRQIVWNQARHNTQAKMPFGVTIAAGGGEEEYRTAVDVTIDNRNVAEWICKSILEYFCYDAPAQELIDQMAQALRDENYELSPVLKTLFLSEAFYSAKAQEGLVKGPIEYAMGFMQATNLPILTAGDGGTRVLDLRVLNNFLVALGQIPTQPPNVNGWPGGEFWLSAQGMVNRANLVETAIADRNDQAAAGIDVADLLPPGTPTASEVVDSLAQRMDVTLSADEHTKLATYLDTYTDSNGTIFTDDPFDPTNPTHVSERVRGLLYILAQHPTYTIR